MKTKLTYVRLALQNIKRRPGRYRTLVLGIILSMTFSSGIPFFTECLNASTEEIRLRNQGRQTTMAFNAQTMDFGPAKEQGTINGEVGYIYVQSYAWAGERDVGDHAVIGWLDRRAYELYYPQVLEGEYPDAPGQIALEKGAIWRMGLDVKVGEQVTMQTWPYGEEGLSEAPVATTYTLVGILSDRKSMIESFDSEGTKCGGLPDAFVCADTPPEDGAQTMIALIDEIWTGAPVLYMTIGQENRLDTSYIRSVSVGDSYYTAKNDIGFMKRMMGLFTLISCLGIFSALSSGLRKRRRQVGLYRAVGATRGQIFRIFACETGVICLVTAPLSIVLSYSVVKCYAWFMGEQFVFLPDYSILLRGVSLGLVCVLLASFLPLAWISRLAPVESIRTHTPARTVRRKIKPVRGSFQPAVLLARRRMRFSRMLQIGVCLIVAVGTLFCCACVQQYVQVKDSWREMDMDCDYQVSLRRGAVNGNNFINSDLGDEGIAEDQRQKALKLPGVAEIYGTKYCNVNLLVSGDYPDYLLYQEYSGLDGESRFINRREAEVLGLVGPGSGAELTADNLREYLHAAENPDYTTLKENAEYMQEVFNTRLGALSAPLLEEYKAHVLDGRIDVEKLNSGEEILLCAPQTLGYRFQIKEGRLASSGLVDLSDGAESTKPGYSILSAQCPFSVGDTLTLSVVCVDENGVWTRVDRAVTIGAVLDPKAFDSNFRLFTTTDGLERFGTQFKYESLDVFLDEELNAEDNLKMLNELQSVFPKKSVRSSLSNSISEKETLRSIETNILTILFLAASISICMINNFLTAHIHDGKRTIGTLRAVGTSERELTRSYLLQIVFLLLLGTALGMAAYLIRWVIGEWNGEEGKIVLWPALVLLLVQGSACFINLKIKLNGVLRHSIVDSIRRIDG